MKYKFFTQWATWRKLNGKVADGVSIEAEKKRLMKLPQANRVAEMAGRQRRLQQHAICCEQANREAHKRRLRRLGLSEEFAGMP